jgi:hypothetical protein
MGVEGGQLASRWSVQLRRRVERGVGRGRLHRALADALGRAFFALGLWSPLWGAYSIGSALEAHITSLHRGRGLKTSCSRLTRYLPWGSTCQAVASVRALVKQSRRPSAGAILACNIGGMPKGLHQQPTAQ